MKIDDRQTVSIAVREILNTREVRQGLSFLVPELLRIWADKSHLKNKITGPLERLVVSGISPDTPGQYPSLFADPGAIRQLSTALPQVLAAGSDALHTLGSTVEEMSPQDQEALLAHLLSANAWGGIGQLITALLRTLSKIHEHNPDYLTRCLEPGFRQFMEGVDFGELREFLDTSSDDIAAFAKMANDVIWQYPAKLVLALSVIPDVANALIEILRESLVRFNNTSPDIVADILMSLLRKVDGGNLGRSVNEILELVRSIHTGSALIGDPGIPKFFHDLSALLEDASRHIDGGLLAKARVALSEDREVIAGVTVNILKENPDLWLKQLERYSDMMNPGIRSKSNRLSALDEFPDDDLADAVDTGLSDIDMQEVAEIANLFAAMVNRVHSLKPELVKQLATQLSGSLDLFEVKEAAERLIDDVGDAFTPIGRAILPQAIKTICRMMAPADDEYENEMTEARDMLRSVLMGEEATL